MILAATILLHTLIVAERNKTSLTMTNRFLLGLLLLLAAALFLPACVDGSSGRCVKQTVWKSSTECNGPNETIYLPVGTDTDKSCRTLDSCSFVLYM